MNLFNFVFHVQQSSPPQCVQSTTHKFHVTSEEIETQ